MGDKDEQIFGIWQTGTRALIPLRRRDSREADISQVAGNQCTRSPGPGHMRLLVHSGKPSRTWLVGYRRRPEALRQVSAERSSSSPAAQAASDGNLETMMHDALVRPGNSIARRAWGPRSRDAVPYAVRSVTCNLLSLTSVRRTQRRAAISTCMMPL
ncbi:hypothetical protein L226DRAFT_163937 [Lentinus tigrinus ALCF2SS1-7]|uniref:Uncharacterized protein n=1 Tax=Lentinus tigrinus ALCF2SS1-6 TaxID=1328759 RepID=A0A5C2S2R1_9APHY|nr:hypothetical protein L227DRAFT_223259 [Lentinus tigrinus ALCF2SS1-6]RPD71866.1 hypothetical protein L226DRAFT_163937 [Lentinus tigrinus ALCF2SS1-7]